MSLKDKVILVTGAAGGIGRASAIAAAGQGARVAVADRDLEGARQTARLVEQAGAPSLALRVDVGQAGDVDAMVADTVAHFGRLDGAFNNAGIHQGHVGMPAGRWATSTRLRSNACCVSTWSAPGCACARNCNT